MTEYNSDYAEMIATDRKHCHRMVDAISHKLDDMVEAGIIPDKETLRALSRHLAKKKLLDNEYYRIIGGTNEEI